MATPDLKEYPAYVTSAGTIGAAISRVLVDPRDSNVIYTTNYFGVSKSVDGGQTFAGFHFQGMETTCVDSVVSDPNISGRAYATIADHRMSVSNDGGGTFTSLPNAPGNTVSMCVAAGDSNLLVAGAGHKDAATKPILWRSDDAGATGKAVNTFGPGQYVESVVNDPLRPDQFYAFVEGVVNDAPTSAGVYRSQDRGTTWQRTANAIPTGNTIPVKASLIDDNLFIIVVYQRKNVFGSERMLCCDPTREGTLYMGEWTTGLFRSDDSGAHWQNVGATLPFGVKPFSVLRCVRADPKVPGSIYAGFLREGLWHSHDYGQTWTKLFPADDREMNITDLNVGGVTGRQLVVVSEPLRETNCPSAIYLSNDLGKTWTDIADHSLGAPIWHGIAVDTRRGLVYAASGGNGLYVTDLAGAVGPSR